MHACFDIWRTAGITGVRRNCFSVPFCIFFCTSLQSVLPRKKSPLGIFLQFFEHRCGLFLSRTGFLWLCDTSTKKKKKKKDETTNKLNKTKKRSQRSKRQLFQQCEKVQTSRKQFLSLSEEVYVCLFSGGPRLPGISASKVALSTMLSQRRGQGGYMPPSNQQQQVNGPWASVENCICLVVTLLRHNRLY